MQTVGGKVVPKMLYIADWSNPDVIFKVDVSKGWENFTVVGKWTGPANWEGYWLSLAQDDDHVYIALGLKNVAKCRVYKIQKSDMTTVKYYEYDGHAWYFNCLIRLGPYLYLGLGEGYYTPKISPRIIKIDKSTMTEVAVLILPGTEATSGDANLFVDIDNPNILWCGTTKQSIGPPFDPIVYKIDLTTFTVITYRVYTSADFGETNSCASPRFLQDSTWLYTFFYRGGRVKISKADLNVFNSFHSCDDIEWETARFMYLKEGAIYVHSLQINGALIKYNPDNLNYIYHRHLFSEDPDDLFPADYDTYPYGLLILDGFPDMYVLDGGWFGPWNKQILKVRDTGSKFIIVDVWTNTDSDAYAAYTWLPPL